MPILLQFADPPVVAFQEEVAARIVIQREAGDAETEYPRPVWSPAARLVLRHESGAEEDLSPQDSGPLPQRPMVARSKNPSVETEVRIPPPPLPGVWTASLELRFAGKKLVAPPAKLTVLPPVALSIVAMASADRIVELAKDGILLEHRLVRLGAGEVKLAPGARLDRIDATSAIPAEAAEGVDPDPLWVVGVKDDTAVARSYGEERVESAPIPLGGKPVWLGPPIVLDDVRRLSIAWAVGSKVRVATVAEDGAVTGPAEFDLPGEVRRGVALGDALFVHVAALPVPPPGGKTVQKAGSLLEKKPPPQQAIFRIRPAAKVPVELFAAVPGTTFALRACPGSLWSLEQDPKKVLSAFRIPLRPGKPERHFGGRSFAAPPIAAACHEDALHLLFRDGTTLLRLDSAGEEQRVSLKPPPPDFAGFVGGRLIAHDATRGFFVAD